MGASVHERIVRICTLIPYLRQHPGTPLADLAAYLGCEQKEVLADLDTILMCGLPPYLPTDYINVAIEGDRVDLQFADQFRRPVRLTMFEALALRLALSSLAGKELAEGTELLRHIDQALPGPLKDRDRSPDERFHFSSLPPAQQVKIEKIEAAIQARQKVQIEYYTADRDVMSSRTIRPYGLVNHAGVWYVVAFCERREREVPFRVDRIKALEALEATFDAPDDFDIDRYGRAEMYVPSERDVRVEIRFDAQLARWIQEEMRGQSIEQQPDGSIRLTLYTHSAQWIVSWLLPYEDHAEVLSPPELRQRMKDACTQMGKVYG